MDKDPVTEDEPYKPLHDSDTAASMVSVDGQCIWSSCQSTIDRGGDHMTDTATLSSKFRISIPKAVRTARQCGADQEFAFIPKGTGVLLVPVPDRVELAGIAKGAKATSYRDRKDRV